MPRDLSASAEEQVLASTSTSAFLIELHYTDSDDASQVYRITTASQNIVTSGAGSDIPDSEWEGVGLPTGETLLGIGTAEESNDMRSGGSLSLTLQGVNQDAISILQNNFFRGHKVLIWKAWFDGDGALTADLLFWKGYQNEAWEIEEQREYDQGSVTVSTRLVSRLAALTVLRAVVTNVNSHRQMLSRAGLATTDTGFQTIPTIVGKTFYWGTDKATGYTDRVAVPRGKAGKSK